MLDAGPGGRLAGQGGRTAAAGQCSEVQSVFPVLHCGLQQRVGTEDWESEAGGFLVAAGPGTLGHRGQPGIVWSGAGQEHSPAAKQILAQFDRTIAGVPVVPDRTN